MVTADTWFDVVSPATVDVFGRVPHVTESQLDDAVSAAAEAQKVWGQTSGHIMARGDVPTGTGFFVKPTIGRDAKDANKIVEGEECGPILQVVPFAGVDHVIARAINSDDGLGGSMQSTDLEAATDIAGRIESGAVWVNQQLNIGAHIPMAGFKRSDPGVEQSTEDLAEHTHVQVINVARSAQTCYVQRADSVSHRFGPRRYFYE